MSSANPFSREFWVMDEPRSNVIQLNTPHARAHARANAAQAAMSLEEDRRATRMAEIEELLAMYQTQRETLNTVMFTLENEFELLRKTR